MKNLRLASAITAVLGFFAVLAVIMLFLALSDIAGGDENLILEWYIAGICIIIISSFIVSTFVTLGLLMRSKMLWINPGLRRA